LIIQRFTEGPLADGANKRGAAALSYEAVFALSIRGTVNNYSIADDQSCGQRCTNCSKPEAFKRLQTMMK